MKMDKIFNLTSTFKALSAEDGGVMIRGMASTVDFDRAGDSISAEAWTKGGLSNFEKNPIILFNHDYDRPIGRATGLRVTANGLELEAKISKSAPANVCELVKEGILGAFSVGFRVKDADYIKETDGLLIKDAELFEVSVVSVPCNQAATFSLAKSFDSIAEYEEFKKTFTNRVDLAGQSLAKEEGNPSMVASETPDIADLSAQKEIKMSEVKTSEIDLDAFAKKVAEETAAKIAMKQAEQKAIDKRAADEAAAVATAKSAQDEQVKQAVVSGVQSGTEALMKDFEAKLAAKDAKIEEVMNQFSSQLNEKAEEIVKMRDSKRVFADRTEGGDLAKHSKDLMHAHMLGVMTAKGWGTQFGQSVLQKLGLDYSTSAGDIDQTVSTQIEKEIQLELKVAALFRELPVNSHATVLPLQNDTGFAKWSTGGQSATNDGTGTDITNRTSNDSYSSNTYQAKQKIITVDRLISTTFMDNYIDERVLVNLMPMLIQGVARSHARSVDKMIIQGNGLNSAGLIASAVTGNSVGDGVGALTSATLTALDLVKARKYMGVYGLNPQDVVFIVSQARYFELLEDPEFTNIQEVGSDLALKITGVVGGVYGSPVVISDNFPAEVEDSTTTGPLSALCVNTANFVIPRLRGVTVEQDYEIANQRRIIVASQHLGFSELFASAAGKAAAVKLILNAA
jgi:HK97 family phage prohead protease